MHLCVRHEPCLYILHIFKIKVSVHKYKTSLSKQEMYVHVAKVPNVSEESSLYPTICLDMGCVNLGVTVLYCFCFFRLFLWGSEELIIMYSPIVCNTEFLG